METTPTESSIAAGWKTMIEKYGCLTWRVPEQYRDVKLLVASNGWNLQKVPEEDRTDELCELAVRNTPFALEFVPYGKRTREMCMDVFGRRMWSIMHIPDKFISTEMCTQFIRDKSINSQLWALSESFRTPELNRLAVETHGINLQWLDESERTDELCMIALKTYGCAIDHFPKTSKLRSSVEVNLEAVKQDGLALNCITVPPTDEMYAAAVASRGCMLAKVPVEKRTRALIESALMSEGTALQFIDENERDDDLCRIAVFSNGTSRGWALKHVPESKKTVELCIQAVKVEPFAYTFVPDAIKAAVDFVEINPDVFQYVDKTFDNCKAFLKKYGDSRLLIHQYIPNEFICAELFE